MVLREAVPQPNIHERMGWYHEKLSSEQADEYLGKIMQDGAFLVRPSREAGKLTISFRLVGGQNLSSDACLYCIYFDHSSNCAVVIQLQKGVSLFLWGLSG